MSAPPPVPSSVRAAIEFLLGVEEARDWLQGAALTARRYSDEWKVDLHTVLVGGAMSCCYAGQVNGREVVLKIPVDPVAGRVEAQWLRLAKGAAPEVLLADDASGVVLMELVTGDGPYVPTASSADIGEYLDLIERLRSSNDRAQPWTEGQFPDLASILEMRAGWAAERFADIANAAGIGYYTTALSLMRYLLRSSGQRMLLHGDLQAKNILRGKDRLMVIDPLPCVGDPLYDIAFWVVMLRVEGSITEMLARIAAAFDLEHSRLVLWAWLIAAVEHRPYLEDHASRVVTFLESAVPQVDARLVS